MKSKFINALMFAAGAAIGSAVTWKVVKTRYERIVKEEIESVKEAINDGLFDIQEPDETDIDPEDDRKECTGQINWDELEDLDEDEYEPTEEDLREYARLADYYNTDEKGGAENMTKDVAKGPYVISPHDFDTLDGYHTIELTYYADEILEDQDYEIVTDADELLGPKALYTFGEYEDDSVYVRNEKLKTDFCILKDYRTYAQARSISPKRVDE